MVRVYYTLPKLRYCSVARLIFFADAVTCVTLWLAGGNTHYMEDMIIHFKLMESVFELACLALLKLCVLFFVFTKLEDLAMDEIEDPYNPKLKRKKAVMHALTMLLTLLSLGYTTTKGVLVLVNKTYNNEEMHATYIACCIAAFSFSLIEFIICLLYPLFLRRLKVFRIKHELTDVGVEIQQGHDGQPIQKKVNLARVLKLAKPEIALISIGMLALIVASLANMATPLFFGYVINAAVNKSSGGTMGDVNRQIIIFCLIGFVGSIAALLRSWLFTLAGIRVVCRIRRDLFAAIIRQEVGFFDTNRTGELTNRLSSDTQVIQNAITVNISMLVRYILQIVGSLVIMFKLSPSLTGVLLSCVPIVAIGAVQYGKFIQRVQKKFQDELAAAGTTAEENISNIRTVRSFCGEGKANHLYDEDIGRSYQEGKKLAGAQGLFNGLIGIVSQGSIALVLWYGAKLVFEGHISIGTMTSFMFYTLNVAMAFAFLSALYGDFMKAVGASQRMFELMDRVPEVNNEGGTVLDEFPCDMRLEHISFTYPSRPDSKVIKDVSFWMKTGSVVALVGPSGGGKSTIVSLIEKFYIPDTGAIKLGDHDMKSLDPSWFRKKMAMVGQEPVLFASSIKDNITYGRNATDQEIEDAARQANAHEFISSFEEGYDTLVGERGVRLSGGQKQRIAIARALIMDPNILLLDEATSALDAESEHLVQEAIDRAMKGRTVLVIAHRLSTVRNASQVIVINKGVVAESGTHDELIQKGGVYKKLVLRQLSAGALTQADVHVNIAGDDIAMKDDDENEFEESDN